MRDQVNSFFSSFEHSHLQKLSVNEDGSWFQGDALCIQHWSLLSEKRQVEIISLLTDGMERHGVHERMMYASSLLYLALGSSNSTQQSAEKHMDSIVRNNQLLHSRGLSGVFFDNLKHSVSRWKMFADKVVTEKLAGDLAAEIDVFLSLVFIIMLVNRDDPTLQRDLSDMSVNPIKLLLDMIDFINVYPLPQFPLKKALMVLHSVTQILLGTMNDSKDLQKIRRQACKLSSDPQGLQTPKASLADYQAFVNDIQSHYPTATMLTHSIHQPHVQLVSQFHPTINFNAVASLTSNTQSALIGAPFIAGVPSAIEESIRVFEKRLYLSCADIEVARERKLLKRGLSPEKQQCGLKSVFPGYLNGMEQSSIDVRNRLWKIETTYAELSPNLRAYMVTLLKILLALTSTNIPRSGESKSSGGGLVSTVVDMCDNLKHKPNTSSSIGVARVALEIVRCKEIAASVLSSWILLMLKHFKSSNVMQYEYMAQILVDANGILLILKTLNQDSIALLIKDNEFEKEQDYFSPTEALVQKSPFDASQGQKDNSMGCTRNFVFIVTMLRTLQLLTKHKPHRIQVLIQYKAANVIKKVLKVDQPNLNFHALKVVKSLVPLLGRKWRQSNMRVLTMIYTSLRPDLCDQVSGSAEVVTALNTSELESIDALYRGLTAQYNRREFEYDDSLKSLVPQSTEQLYDDDDDDTIVLDEYFMRNYESWLEEEVYSKVSMDHTVDMSIESMLVDAGITLK